MTARHSPLPVLGTKKETSDQLVSQVIPIVNVPAELLVKILRPMVPQEGHLDAYVATNSLIITDRAANIQRLVEIIRLIDKPDNEDIAVVKLQHASASDIVSTLTPLQRITLGGSGNSKAMQLMADERSNSVLITGNRAVRDRVRGLINRLDTPIESNGNMRVIFLRFAKAADLAEILLGVNSGQQKMADGEAGNAQVIADETGEFIGNMGLSPTHLTVDDRNASLEIQTDPHTNSLIINAPPDQMQQALEVIRQLDIRRPQVMVEAVIAEITEDSIRELGVNFLVDGARKGAPAGYTNLGGDTERLLGNLNSTRNGSEVSSLDDGVSFALGKFASENIDFGLLLKAISSNAHNNILSTPTIVTLDNEEAEIVVGSNVPFVTGRQLSSNNDNPFQTIERSDVGLTLKVTPQINDGDTIRLELDQEVSNVNASALSGAADITTSKRALSTTVLVENGQTLVLGGLIDDQSTEYLEKVPLLGDIPVLGRIFQYRSTRKSKKNLMIFLRPVILRDADATSRVGAAGYGQMRSSLTASRRKVHIGGDNQPGLVQPELPRLQVQLNRSETGSSRALGKLRREPDLEVIRKLDNGELQWVALPDGSMKLLNQ